VAALASQLRTRYRSLALRFYHGIETVSADLDKSLSLGGSIRLLSPQVSSGPK